MDLDKHRRLSLLPTGKNGTSRNIQKETQDGLQPKCKKEGFKTF